MTQNIIPNVHTVGFGELTDCENDEVRMVLLNRRMRHHFAILASLINLDCQGFPEKNQPNELMTVKLGGKMEFADDGEHFWDCGMLFDEQEYLRLRYDADQQEWILYAIHYDMGNRETPPNVDYIELDCSGDFTEIMETTIQEYHNIIAQFISESTMADDYAELYVE